MQLSEGSHVAPWSYMVILKVVLENSANTYFQKVVKSLLKLNPGYSEGSKVGHSDFSHNFETRWEP